MDIGPLDHEWHQRFHSAFVIEVRVPELLGHERFFKPQFEPPAESGEWQRQQRSQLSLDQRSAENRQEKTRVNGVANNGIRSRLNQLVLLLDGDAATPIAAQEQTRPD